MKANNCIKLLILGVIFTSALSSCKKGEEDPFFSLRSRKQRVVGDWNFTTFNQDLTTVYSASNVTIHRTEDVEFVDAENFNIEVTTTTTNPSKSVTIEETGTLTDFHINFAKDGNFEMIKSYVVASTYSEKIDTSGTPFNLISRTMKTSKNVIESYVGSWNFLAGVEKDNYKNKERIALNFTKITITENNTIDSTTKFTTHIPNQPDNVITTTTKSSITSGTTSDYVNGENTVVWALKRLANDEILVDRTINNFYSNNSSTVTNSIDNLGNPTLAGSSEIKGSATSNGIESFTLSPKGSAAKEE